MLSPLLQIKGVQSAFITDDSGHLIAASGRDLQPPAGVLVLTQAAISAASEFGRRSGVGVCEELIQHHAGGAVFLRSLPQFRTLVVRCQTDTPMNEVRQIAASLSIGSAAPQPACRAREAASLDLSDALHAMPAW
ncbi:MAG: hypothetical protein RIS79_3165 [Verrucomicrobiota bacterium]|jgi:hypothetical protein